MGQDLELDFEKYCVVDGSPKTVLLSPPHPKLEKRKSRKKPICRNEVSLSNNDEFTKINLHRYRSASCRPGESTRSGADESRKRGSVYQSSNEVGKKMVTISKKELEGRKKIEFLRLNAPFPLEIFDSLCSSDDDDDGSFSGSFLETSRDSIKKRNLSNKSLSSRLEVPQSPMKSEPDSSKTNTSKTHFTPFRKMLDPFVKSKSRKSPLGSSRPDIRNLRKSWIQDFTNADFDSGFLKKDSCSSITSSSYSISPAHLTGVLKLGNKNRMPVFEFSVKNPNDVLVAKTWKDENAPDWVYTFHTARNRRTINSSGRGFNDHNTTVSQMPVSCYLCTELVNSGSFDNSMVTEFVLYDLKQPVDLPPDQENESSDQENVGFFWPRFAADLPPDLETVTIVIRERDGKRDDWLSSGTVSVVVPLGNHGLPSDESCGPSPLLDRWRLGGGCGCGGWDMGCPLVVFGNSSVSKGEACKEPIKLFLKVTKENTPALTMKMAENGQYVVDFHAQLTSVQAFSICVAILHSTRVSVTAARDEDRERLQCDSLRVFVEDEVKHLIEAVAEEDKRKLAKNENQPSFSVNPLFSPMSRA